MTLPEFLLARLGADEQAIRTAWHDDDIAVAPFTVTRLLSDIETKRSIVHALGGFFGDNFSIGLVDYTLGNLALLYADHPDYRQEWKP